MARSGNQKALIDDLESLAVLNHRYSNIVCINCPETGSRRGVCSLVFHATDDILGEPIAIKFMDPDCLGDRYRIAAFQREPELLDKVLGRQRCLQLVEGIQTYNLNVPLGGTVFNIPLQYFVTEWIEEDIDEYSLQQDQISAVDKLQIFRLVILALESLHQYDIHHRDIKIDNIRLKTVGTTQVAIFIDYGTAARIDSPPVATSYGEPVGANGFAPPESFAGLAGDRKIGSLADKYSIGALLFSLFNKDEFYIIRHDETDFSKTIGILMARMSTETTREGKISAWSEEMIRLRHLATVPDILRYGLTIPPVARNTLRECYTSLTEFDFNRRNITLTRCRMLVDIAIKTLTSQQAQSDKYTRMKAARKRRRNIAETKRQKLDLLLSKRGAISNA